MNDAAGGEPPDGPGVPWRRIGLTVLVPNLLNSLGQGVATTAAPLAAAAVTNSYTVAAAVAALLTVGQFCSTLPAGWLVDRVGERSAMIAASVVTGTGALLAFLGGSIVLLGAGATLIGAGVSVFAMARHAWITVVVPAPARGRTLSAVAGVTRLGTLLGPFLAAAAFHLSGHAGSAFLVVAGTAVVLLPIVITAKFPSSRISGGPDERRGVLGTMWDRRGVLLQLGLTVSVIGSMRTGRRLLVPLIGVGLGWQDASIALLIGVTGAVDLAVCYLGGALVDRVGRTSVAVGTLVLFGIAHLVLPLAIVSPAGDVLYVGSVALMAVANGVSGGLVPTIGSDLADPNSPATFLSSWRLITDAGGAAAPVVVVVASGMLGLGPASLVLACAALLAAAVLPRFARRHLGP
ncbi:MFS transporter [Myceligenerans halotolerans]